MGDTFGLFFGMIIFIYMLKTFSVWIENVWVPAHQRLKDASIMSRFAQVKGATEHKLRIANECRLFLRVITIAELANVDGRFISPDRLDGSWQAQSTIQ